MVLSVASGRMTAALSPPPVEKIITGPASLSQWVFSSGLDGYTGGSDPRAESEPVPDLSRQADRAAISTTTTHRSDLSAMGVICPRLGSQSSTHRLLRQDTYLSAYPGRVELRGQSRELHNDGISDSGCYESVGDWAGLAGDHIDRRLQSTTCSISRANQLGIVRLREHGVLHEHRHPLLRGMARCRSRSLQHALRS